MRLKLLIAGFLLSITIISLTGFYALGSSQKILKPFNEAETHFQAIATAATEVTSYAKRAEGHLMLYLSLHRTRDKEKFPQRVTSLFEEISILDQNIKNPDARAILNTIKPKAEDILTAGNSLITAHDTDMAATGKFDMEKYRETILDLHNVFADIRQSGVDLATLEIKLENDLKLDVLKNAEKLQYYLKILLAVTSFFALYIGFTLINIILRLNREIAARKLTQETLQSEQQKLQQALSKVKTLSGLIPICSFCKNIRDDNGYWRRIENYIKTNSDADFSHGICPECKKKLYPELIDDKLKS